MIEIKVFVVNDFGVNSYVLSDETYECLLIDAGYYTSVEQSSLYDYISERNLKPVMLACTHCHIDHILGNYDIADKYKIPIAAHRADDFLIKNSKGLGQFFGFSVKISPEITKYLEEGEPIKFGNSVLEVLHVPGHSPGSVVFYNRNSNFIIAGDVLFKNSIGRTDLPGGNYNTLLTGIKSKLLVLPPATVVYPGHGPSTTIKEENDTNPFLQ